MATYKDSLTILLRRAFSVSILCTLFSPAFLDADDYHLALTQWWEQSSVGKLINRSPTHQGLPLLRGQTAALPNGSIMQLEGAMGEVFRLGSNTNFTLLHDRQFRLSAGPLIIYLPAASDPVRIQGPATEFWLRGEGTLALQVTSNRGMKIICLSHKPQLALSGHITELIPSKLYFLPPNVPRIGRSATIDLGLFLRTSKLIQAFKARLPSSSIMKKTAFRQSINIKSRSNLFVGDATSPNDFDLLVVEDQ